MQNSLRLFIAVELSQDVHERLSRLIGDLQRQGARSTRWVKAENLHLTLKFLGDTSLTTLPKLKETLLDICGKSPSFQMVVKGTGVFPSLAQPRVLWAGLNADPELTSLVQLLESNLEKLGYKKESRPFSPHLTLARVAYPENSPAFEGIMKILLSEKASEFGTVRVRRVTLFQSTLSPDGSIYTPLERYTLAEK